MKSFSFPRFWNVVKYLFRIDRKWYLGWALAAPLLQLTGIAFFAMLGMLFNGDFVNAGTVGYVTSSLYGIFPYVICCCVFHAMYNKNRREALLTLPANTCEKYTAMIVINAGVLLIMNLLSTIICVAAVGWDELSNVYTQMFDYNDFWRSEDALLAVGMYVAYACVLLPAVMLLINARIFRFNIIAACVVASILNGLFMTAHIVVGMSMAADSIRTICIIAIAVILLLAAACCVGSYICFKRAQLRDFFNR